MKRFLLDTLVVSILFVSFISFMTDVTAQRQPRLPSTTSRSQGRPTTARAPSSPTRTPSRGRNSGGETEREERGRGRGGKFSLAYFMADGAEDVIGGSPRETFSCEGRDYGYYADLDNNCQLYHVCVPPSQQYTFFCNNGTVFDQKALTCVREGDSTPCSGAEKYYALNQNFGVIDNNDLILLD